MSYRAMSNTTMKSHSRRSKRWEVQITPLSQNNIRLYLLPKQARVLELMQEKGDLGVKSTKKDLLLEAGYSENTARKPAQVFGSASFREVFEGVVPDKTLVEVHKDLFGAVESKEKRFPLDTEDTEIERIVVAPWIRLQHIEIRKGYKVAHITKPDSKTISRALDLAYRVNGIYQTWKQKKAPWTSLTELFRGAMAARGS